MIDIYKLLEMDCIPESMIRWGIRRMLDNKIKAHTLKDIEHQQAKKMAFVTELKSMPIAIETDAANEQHYELPAEFFELVLGPHHKYSSALWEPGVTELDVAESAMLETYIQRARIRDGQQILELGCGWGSFSLYLAQKFPNTQITGVSNSKVQRAYIEAKIADLQLKNLTILTHNMTTFSPACRYDRIISIEMLEHMKNYELLFKRISQWLLPDGLFFVHIFTHREFAYHYEDVDGTDWLTRYFFTGGTMPSMDLFHYFQKHLTLIEQWSVSGTHYEKTANAWLKQMKKKRTQVLPILEMTYGKQNTKKWWAYWKIFFLACAELWGFENGNQWQVSHYLFQKQQIVNL